MKQGISVALTAVGAITPYGTGIEEFLAALPGLSRIETGGSEPPGEARQCLIREEQFAEMRGAKYFDRCTKLLYSAVRQYGGGLDGGDAETDRVCIAVGTAFSSITDFMEFLLSFERGGLRGLNPIVFPNTVQNCPASQLAILLKIRGANITLTSGLCAGLDALIAGYQMIDSGRMDRVIAGGVEESSVYTRAGFHNSLKSCPEHSFALAEAAGIVLLEQVPPGTHGAQMVGYAQSFFPGEKRTGAALSAAIERSMKRALAHAGLTPDDVSCLSLSANGLTAFDQAEFAAAGRLLQESRRPKRVLALKKLIGETAGAAGLLQTIAGANDRNLFLPHHHADCLPAAFVERHRQQLAEVSDGGHVLVNAVNWEGNISTVVVKPARG